MKTITLIALLFITGSSISFAQCSKNFTLTSSKTEHLDEKGNVTQTVDEKAFIEVNKQNVQISLNDNREWSGTIKADTCNWTVPYKNGKSVLKTVLTNNNGAEKNITLTIEGKDGKLTLQFEMEGEPEKIKVGIDSYQEKG